MQNASESRSQDMLETTAIYAFYELHGASFVEAQSMLAWSKFHRIDQYDESKPTRDGLFVFHVDGDSHKQVKVYATVTRVMKTDNDEKWVGSLVALSVPDQNWTVSYTLDLETGDMVHEMKSTVDYPFSKTRLEAM